MAADIRKLAMCGWRGILFPAKSIKHRFAHESSPQHVSYAEGDFIDMTGTRARTWAITIPFNESLIGWESLFSETYLKFYDAYRDRSDGMLTTPLQGPVLCKPGSYEDDLEPTVLDGIGVEVIFTEHTPVEGSKLDAPPNLTSLFAEALAVDDAAKATNKLDVDTLSKPMVDPLTAVTATVNKLNSARDKVKGKILTVSNRANNLEVALDKLGANGGPKCNAARLAARRLRLRSETLANAPPRDVPGIIDKEVTDTPQTVAQLAIAAKMDLQDFLSLNYTLAKMVLVPPGTTVLVVRK